MFPPSRLSGRPLREQHMAYATGRIKKRLIKDAVRPPDVLTSRVGPWPLDADKAAG